MCAILWVWQGERQGGAVVIIGDSEPGGRIACRCGETLPDLASFDAHSVTHGEDSAPSPADVPDLTRAPGVR